MPSWNLLCVPAGLVSVTLEGEQGICCSGLEPGVTTKTTPRILLSYLVIPHGMVSATEVGDSVSAFVTPGIAEAQRGPDSN